MKLKKINLKKSDGHNHPYIRTDGSYYLVKIHGALFVGNFSSQWYGLCFHGGVGRMIQFDAPGTNASQWQGIWEVME